MKALKDFTTTRHRFHEGDAVTAAHDLSPHDREDLEKRGFIGDDRAQTKRKTKAEEPEPAATTTE